MIRVEVELGNCNRQRELESVIKSNLYNLYIYLVVCHGNTTMVSPSEKTITEIVVMHMVKTPAHRLMLFFGEPSIISQNRTVFNFPKHLVKISAGILSVDKYSKIKNCSAHKLRI